MRISPEKIGIIKSMYPHGTRIRLIKMMDTTPVRENTLGTVMFVDDIGQIHVKWDDGNSLALIPGIDQFTVVDHTNGYINHRRDNA